MAELRKHFSALQIIHHILELHVSPGDLCIDATAGRGRDTLFLSELTGASGHVTAFDIQQEALDSTRELLLRNQKSNFDLILDSHANMQNYFQPETVSCITFNFGWLPAGDHHIFTKPESSIEAIQQGLKLLKPDGLMTLILYYGRETGFRERDALLEFLPALDSNFYTVVEMPFVNRQNCPPIPIVIFKDR
ncbi:MAG: class I SAM-dependent methyltransferase [Oscillospiraceae bacterium]|nr:class I SAM-dependent methyltransferase [Oscillospiraceae bacterium]